MLKVSSVRRHLELAGHPAIATAHAPRKRGWRQVTGAIAETFRRSDGVTIFETSDLRWKAYFLSEGQFADYVMVSDGEGGDSEEIMEFSNATEAMAYMDKGYPLNHQVHA